jgi:hypothetical protein
MAAKLTRLTHRIAIKLHLVAESYTIRSSRFTWPVRKFLYILSYYGNYTDLIQEFFCVDRREAYKPQLRFELITF